MESQLQKVRNRLRASIRAFQASDSRYGRSCATTADNRARNRGTRACAGQAELPWSVGLRARAAGLAGPIIAGEFCPGSGQQPGDDSPLACWLPVRDGLTPHALRHSHKTWMAEDGISEILAEHRLGHDIPGMRGLYAHVSHRMREELTAALQAR